MARNVVLLLLLGWLGVAGQGQKQPAPTPAKCELDGQVINTTTGKPVAGLSIYVLQVPKYPISVSRGGGATTDSTGHFEIQLEPSVRYRVQGWRYDSTKHFYVPSSMDHGPDAVFSLRPEERLTGLEFHTQSPGEIDGRVLDEDGHPSGEPVMVEAVRVAYSYAGDGKKYLQLLRSVRTDKQGAYILNGLPPNRYFIEVYRPGGLQLSARGPLPIPGSDFPSHASRLPAAEFFYPDSVNPAGAKEVAVGPGAKIEGIDFRFPTMHRFNVSGSATSEMRGGGPYITMLTLQRNAYYASNLVGAATFLQPDGPFRLHDISPGDYTVLAMQGVQNTPYNLGLFGIVRSTTVAVGTTNVEVRGQNVTDVNVKMSPPVDRSPGRMVLEGNAAVSPGKILIQLVPGGPETTVQDTKNLYVQVSDDGSFFFKSLFAGSYAVRVNSPVPGTYIESIRMGTQDALAHPLEIRPGTAQGTLEVKVGFDSAAISGTVVGTDGQPIQGATVVLVPELSLRGAPELYRSAVTDQNDRFVMQGIRPGKYTVYAWRMIDTGAWFDPGVMRAASGLGVAIELGKGEEKTVQLRAIPLAKTPPLEP